MEITDVNIDCLMICFDHLNVIELLDVAVLNKHLNHAARYIFARKYGQKMVFLSVLKSNKLGRMIFSDNILHIIDLKTGLQFLRCFGDLISEIKIVFQDDKNIFEFPVCPQNHNHWQIAFENRIKCLTAYKYEHLIIGYINEYCSKSLIKIEFDGKPKGALNKLTKTFIKVEKFENLTICYNPIEMRLHKIFPKIRELKLIYTELHNNEKRIYNSFIAYKFPHLEHLMINVSPKLDIEKFDIIDNFVIALRANSQLKILEGNIWFDVIFDKNNFYNPNEYLQNLETLRLSVHKTPINFNENLRNLHLKNLKDLDIDISYCGKAVMPFSSNQLESLTISLSPMRRVYMSIWNKEFYDLFNKFPTLKKFKFSSSASVININHSDMSKILPLLEEIYFDQHFHYFTLDEAVNFIQSFHSLRVFHFIAKISENDLLARLDNYYHTWSASCDVLEGHHRYKIFKLKRQPQQHEL